MLLVGLFAFRKRWPQATSASSKLFRAAACGEADNELGSASHSAHESVLCLACRGMGGYYQVTDKGTEWLDCNKCQGTGARPAAVEQAAARNVQDQAQRDSRAATKERQS